MNATDAKRPLRFCPNGEPHALHFWLFNGGPHGGEYSRCPGRPENGDPSLTRTDIPIQMEPERDGHVHLSGPYGTSTALEGYSFALPGATLVVKPWDEPFPPDSDLAHIIMELLPEIDAHMRLGGAHYGYTVHRDLGLRGQYADMYRKWALLKRFMWEDETPLRESLREILKDMIGHALLTIAMIDGKTDAKD